MEAGVTHNRIYAATSTVNATVKYAPTVPHAGIERCNFFWPVQLQGCAAPTWQPTTRSNSNTLTLSFDAHRIVSHGHQHLHQLGKCLPNRLAIGTPAAGWLVLQCCALCRSQRACQPMLVHRLVLANNPVQAVAACRRCRDCFPKSRQPSEPFWPHSCRPASAYARSQIIFHTLRWPVCSWPTVHRPATLRQGTKDQQQIP
eukprot:351934-Chlamydomonas_euryale.AAC.11